MRTSIFGWKAYLSAMMVGASLGVRFAFFLMDDAPISRSLDLYILALFGFLGLVGGAINLGIVHLFLSRIRERRTATFCFDAPPTACPSCGRPPTPAEMTVSALCAGCRAPLISLTQDGH
jgi:hypothetical protein